MSKLPKTILLHEALASAGVLKEDTANKKTSLADNSDTYFPSQQAVNEGLALKADASDLTILNNFILCENDNYLITEANYILEL